MQWRRISVWRSHYNTMPEVMSYQYICEEAFEKEKKIGARDREFVNAGLTT